MAQLTDTATAPQHETHSRVTDGHGRHWNHVRQQHEDDVVTVCFVVPRERKEKQEKYIRILLSAF